MLSRITTLRFGIGSSRPGTFGPQPPWARYVKHRAASPSQEREPNTTSITWLRLPTRYIVLSAIKMSVPPLTPMPAPCVSWITLWVKVMP